MKFFSILFLSCALASCVISMPEREQRQNLLAPPCLESTLNEGLSSGFFEPGSWPDERWWIAFDSPELSGLIERALASNPSLQEAEARIRFAVSETGVAYARLYPWISFEAEDDYEYLSKNGLYRALNPRIPLSANLIDLTLSLTYEFDFWGKNRNRVAAALGRASASRAEAAQSALVVSTSLAAAYFTLKADLVKRDLLMQLASVTKSRLQLNQSLERSALNSRFAPLLSSEGHLESEKALQDVQRDIEIVVHQIQILMGLSPDCPLALNMEDRLRELSRPLALPCDLSIDLLARRPDLMAEIWQAKALAFEVGAAIADFFPDVNLTAFVGLESVFFSRLFKGSSITAGVDPALHLPIFTAGAIRSNVMAKKAAFQAAVFAYNNLLLKSAAEVADLVSTGRAVFQKKIEQERIVADASESYALTLLRTRKGLASGFEGYDYEEALIIQELADLDLLLSQYLISIQLIRALGGGYVAPFMPLTPAGGPC